MQKIWIGKREAKEISAREGQMHLGTRGPNWDLEDQYWEWVTWKRKLHEIEEWFDISDWGHGKRLWGIERNNCKGNYW